VTSSVLTVLEILLSAHAQTLKAVIWHQEQKLVQCSTCKQRFGQFRFFLARQRPKNGLTRFKRHFLAKFPGVNGLSKVPNFLVKSTFEHKTTKSSHKMPNPVKKTIFSIFD